MIYHGNHDPDLILLSNCGYLIKCVPKIKCSVSRFCIDVCRVFPKNAFCPEVEKNKESLLHCGCFKIYYSVTGNRFRYNKRLCKLGKNNPTEVLYGPWGISYGLVYIFYSGDKNCQ